MFLEVTMAFALSSPAFEPMQKIPAVYTCDSTNISPALAWQDIPAGTRSLALIVDDPDAPDPQAPTTVWVHWILYNLPADSHGLAQGMTHSTIPANAKEGLNDWHQPGYRGPCPPIGRHRYFFKLYALDTVLKDLHKPGKAQLEDAMQGHIIAETKLVGTYKK